MNPNALFVDPPAWSLAVGTLGRGLIVLSAISFLATTVLGFTERLRVQRWAFHIGSFSIVGAFLCLLSLSVTGQFHFGYVWEHTMKDLELQYRISAVWAGQEGSFLLWALMSTACAWFARRRTAQYEGAFLAICAAILGSLAGILAFESPFRLIEPLNGVLRMPLDGRGLSPALLNYWMVIHPPTIFLGFGALIVPFALATAALIKRNLNDWVPIVRPWALFGLTFNGLGLCMGGFWAYEMLNWGGFWMWDPVENTSFVPWVTMVAFIHAIFVQIARKKWHLSTALLGAVPFMCFCYGTFLTRSGFLGDTSVHSFAQMDRSALWILVGIAGFAIFGFLALWTVRLIAARKSPDTEAKPIESFPLNRTSGYATAIWLLIAFGVITAFGMSVPMIMSLRGVQPKMVEEHLYHSVLSWFFPPFMLALALFPMVTWRGMRGRDLLVKVNQLLAVSIFITGMLLVGLNSDRVWIPFPMDRTVEMSWGQNVPALPFVLFLTWLCVFALVTNLAAAAALWKRARPSIGGLITHFGFAMTLLGLIFSRGFEQKAETLVHPDIPGEAFGYRLAYLDAPYQFTDRHNKMRVLVRGNGEEFEANPGLYFMPPNEPGGDPNPVVWPAIRRHPFWDLILIVYPMDFQASNPTTFAKGDLRAHQQITLTYKGYTSNGEIGPGAHFIAEFEFQGLDGEPKIVKPELKLVLGGAEPVMARLDDVYELRLDAVMAETGDAVATLFYINPAYPVEVFYKPLTILVWLGVGLMTFGGLMSARYRKGSVGPTSGRDTGEEDRSGNDESGESNVQSKESDEVQPTTQI
ncbi:MAG: cytochrome c biogenesis protein CcsA [Fimbriimonadaceae bacterium]|nr:cytochrome c biogenesis protein CcsA [Fimbriimonadaceae bacterium]MBX3334579.1 cytochrome c biogenesis protein CcsA [Nitrospira sp.]